ncbi:MAG TPA: peptidoglycan DD-metalloendopeptidase family protein [Egicoccus sp.]|nr:peptidoglycan DD-metalloendopeptidase family protein [Egicoccus sp.]HSK22773.1 peptidoglycan DD-metalloendopeptidase family protein [Egicoccus sp.]
MRSRSLRATALAVVVILVGLVVPTVAGAQQAEERQLQAARDRLDELSRDISQAESRASEADAELADADARLDEVEAVVNEVAAAVERQQGAVAEAEQRLIEVEQEAQEVEAAFADRAARMFKEGPSVPFQLLLDSEGAEAAMSRSSYLRVITQADRVTIESLEAAEIAVAAERRRFDAERERLEAMLAEQEELLAEVAQLRESRALAAAVARDDLEQLEHEHDELEEESNELAELIKERQAEARRQAKAAASSQTGSVRISAPSSSGYAWPMCAPVTSEYGPRWGRRHSGVDQGASTGTAIGASKAGTVIFAGRQGGYGNLTLIDHHDGVVTAYAHQSSIAVGAGQSVAQGQRIGAVGSTGNSTGPHLHFETRVNGSPVNPRQYLPGSPC